MDYSNSLFLLEPMCKGIDHARINGDYARLFMENKRFENIFLFSEKDHYQEIVNNDFKTKSVINIPLKIHLKHNLFSVFKNLLTFYKIFKLSKRSKFPILILSSNLYLLFQLKLVLYLTGKRAIFILHGFISELDSNVTKRFFFNVSKGLRLFSSKRGFNYVTLGSFVKDNLLKLEPSLGEITTAINLPIKTNNFSHENKDECIKSVNGNYVFGSAGIAALSKGSHHFFSLAKDCEDIPNYDFIYIGSTKDKYILDQIENYKSVKFYSQISIMEYEMKFSQFDFLLLFYPKSSYRLGFSGVFLDMISHEKPLIALENDFFRFYFDKYGDLGWLFSDYNALKTHVESFPTNDYSENIKRFKANIKLAKSDFDAQIVSHEFDNLFLLQNL